MNVNWNSAASVAQWGNYQQTQRTETTGAIANNSTPVFGRKNTETAGAIAMFGAMGGAQEQGGFMAVA